MATERLRMEDEVIVELTRRAAAGGLHATGTGTWQNNAWAQYTLLLAMASRLLAEAPQSEEACAELAMIDGAIESQVGKALAHIIEAVHAVLPGGIMEIMCAMCIGRIAYVIAPILNKLSGKTLTIYLSIDYTLFTVKFY